MRGGKKKNTEKIGKRKKIIKRSNDNN